MDSLIKTLYGPTCNWCNGSGNLASFGIDVSAGTPLCRACNGEGKRKYAGMTDYLEEHGEAWPFLIWFFDKIDEEWWLVNDEYGDAAIPSRFNLYYHALPYISGDGNTGALDILEREFGRHWWKDYNQQEKRETCWYSETRPRGIRMMFTVATRPSSPLIATTPSGLLDVIIEEMSNEHRP